jgi:hypothetical protein
MEQRYIETNYYRSCNNYEKLDGYLAIFYFVYYVLLVYTLGYFRYYLQDFFSIIAANAIIGKFSYYSLSATFSLFPLLIVLKVRKQPLSSLGIKNEKNILAVTYGVLASVPFLVIRLIFTSHFKDLSISNYLMLFIYYLVLIGFVEEITFRGFIQTRIYALVRNPIISIIIGATFFSIMHIPFQYQISGMTIFEFISKDYQHLLVTFFMHIYFVVIFNISKRNIIAPTVTHSLVNFFQAI